MARLRSERSGWRAVRDPEADEYFTIASDEHGREGDDIDREVAERLADAHGPLSIVEDEDGDSPAADEAADRVDELLDGTVPDVREALEDGEFDDRLDELESRESDRQGRDGVQEAIETRRDELEE